ncbi:MAG: hypothetical protein DRQ88_02985 [Epsilonproteobacteria bacterium]|nr:MAG: hypothetical protein DRQ89_01940 [Campylobacterota bacterium]RLA67437.1 MAG: hypothetical protein DRQ88_02985 [Campylobacterota bacterium]
MTIIKYSLFFVFSFLILSIPISGNPVFYHLHKPLKPYIKVIFNKVEKESKEKIKEGKELGAKILINTVSKETN